MRQIPSVKPATAGDYDAVCRLLVANDLPVAGLDPSLQGFVVAEVNGVVVGSCGMERAGDSGLLRSVAVDPSYRGLGVGRALVEAVIFEARQHQLRGLYLLTTTAADWFPAFGFTAADRAEAPPAIRATEEFSGACPASAAMLRMDLTPSPEASAGTR